jgi:hypothetical protein
MKKTFFIAFLILCIATVLPAQQFLTPSFGFSHKKTSYVILTDGSEITGTLKDVDRKKGLIEFVNIEDGEGKKHKLKAAKIKFMYLPPTAFDNLGKAVEFAHSAQRWNEKKLNEDLINQGYVYFENAKVKIKKKESVLLMQLLNPAFSEKVKVYHDPFAKESMSLGFAGVDVVGGNDKSYYVHVDGSKAAFRLYKKNYKDEYAGLWAKCTEVKKKYPVATWLEFPKHVVEYTNCAE